MLYFSYGSNLNLDRMFDRCPNAEPIGPATLKDYRLLFRGVADIEPSKGHEVVGALWEITDECEAALDVYEGYNARVPLRGMYRKEFVKVRGHDGKFRRALVYVMNRGRISPPQTYYLEVIAEGYRDFALPKKALLAAVTQTLVARDRASA